MLCLTVCSVYCCFKLKHKTRNGHTEWDNGSHSSSVSLSSQYCPVDGYFQSTGYMQEYVAPQELETQVMPKSSLNDSKTL